MKCRIPIDWYAGHDENVPYTEADPNLLEDEPIAQEGDEEDDEGEEMDGDEAEEDDDVVSYACDLNSTYRYRKNCHSIKLHSSGYDHEWR